MNRKIISRILVFLMGLLLLTGCIEKKETVQETADAGTTQEVAVAEAAPGVILPQDAKIGIAYVGESGGFTVDFLAKTEGYLIAAGLDQTVTTESVGGQGFTGIMVSWLAKFNPLGMILTSGLIQLLSQGAAQISQDFDVSGAFPNVIVGIILFFIIGCEFFINYKIHFRGHHDRAYTGEEGVK